MLKQKELMKLENTKPEPRETILENEDRKLSEWPEESSKDQDNLIHKFEQNGKRIV